MQTELFSTNKSQDIDRAAQLLLAGELVAVPTETVYGLAADASNPEAVRKIFVAKKRPVDHPLITHIHGPDALEKWAKNIPDWVYPLTERFWPGPLTLILEKQDWVPDIITGGQTTIGLRMPNQPQLLDLLLAHDLAVAAPSANPYQRLSPTTAKQVLAGLNGKISAVLDGGPCSVGTESTILSAVNSQPKILRTGAITAAELQRYIAVEIESPIIHHEAVSGNKEIHYQPNTIVRIKSTSDILSMAKSEAAKLGIIAHSSQLRSFDHPNLNHLSDDPVLYRHNIYATLFQLDQLNLDEIWVEKVPEKDTWADITDRLTKASS